MSEPKDQEPAEPPATDAPAPDTAEASPDAAVTEERRKKKKRKKRRPEEDVEPAADAAVERPARDADGRDRPRFLLQFPEDPSLEELIAAFEAGNFAAVRADAPRLIERTDRPEVKRAAEELLRRIEPDPLVKFLLGVAVFLFVAVVAYVYYAHG